MKNQHYVYVITIVIAGLLITNVPAFTSRDQADKTTLHGMEYSALPVKQASESTTLSVPSEPVEPLILRVPSSSMGRAITRWTTPALADAHNGILALASRYQLDDLDVIAFTGSTDDGKAFRIFDHGPSPPGYWWNCIYWPGYEHAHHPVYDLRFVNASTQIFAGTFVPPAGYSGDPFLVICDGDPTLRDSYSGISWPFGQQGYHDIKSVDIACDTTDTELVRWGVMSLVISYNGLFDIPCLFFQNSSGEPIIIYNPFIEGCDTTHCEIDEEAQMVYRVYDWFNSDTFQYQLLICQDDWSEMKTWDGPPYEWQSAVYIYAMNELECGIRYPAVAASNNNIVVVAERTNDSHPEDADIICFHTATGNISDLEMSVVAASTASELYPELQHVGGYSFVCTFTKDGKQYSTRTNDGGETWGTPVLVSGGENVRVEYGNADIAENGSKIMWGYEQDASTTKLDFIRLGTHVYLSDSTLLGMNTCPAGDGGLYSYVVVTVWDSNGNPVPGIPASSFAFTVSAVPIKPYMPATRYYDGLSCTFVPVDSMTNAAGQIRFRVRGDTSIIYDIYITATLYGHPLKDRDKLTCKSFDLDISGCVGLGDFVMFAQQYGHSGPPVWYVDYCGWDGIISLCDFVLFAQHFGHCH
jgi:hypothetical protein